MRTAFAHELVWRQAASTPNAIAVSGLHESVTYRDLISRTQVIAARLAAMGVGREATVAVAAGRSASAVAALLGVLRSGGCYAPVDLAGPAERVAAMLSSLAAVAVVADTKSASAARQLDLPVLDLDEITADTGHARLPGPHPDALAYVLYTSGSTGTPKGVSMSHRGLSRLISWQLGDQEPGLTTLHFTAVGFDVTFQEVLSTLASGGRLCLVTDDVRRDPEKLLIALTEHRVERVFLPYVALQELAMAAARLGVIPRDLRQIVTAGEALVITDAIAAFFERMPGCRLDNQYGPTETHLVTSLTLGPGPAPWPTVPAIGTEADGVHVHLLDEDLRKVPAGSAGQLYVGGEGVARGYLGDPSQTAECFVSDPFAPEPGARMYRTGDLARRAEDGMLHFLGRTDAQLKVRGYRVEPSEVEAALAAHPAVRQAAVGLRALGDGRSGLAGYLVAEGTRPAVSELIAHLAPRLPEYMVPSRFMFLDALPLTATGKIDRRSLPEIALPEPGGSDVDARAPMEEIIESIWRRVLGHDEFDQDEDFFDIGGDSLLAVWVVTELSRTLGRAVELSVLLEDSTVEDLAARLRADGGRPAADCGAALLVTLRPGPTQRVLVLFHALGGEVLAYRELARELTAPVRVVGASWASHPRTDVVSLPAVAAEHAGQLRALTNGPYLLAGWSFGGVLAYEVAQQLRREGSEVEFLGLIDAHPLVDPISGLPRPQTPYLDGLNELIAEIDRGEAAGDRSADVAQFASEETWTQLMGAVPARSLSVDHLRAHLALARDNTMALRAYEPEPYDGDVDYFRATALAEDSRRVMAQQFGALVSGTLRVHDIEADHLSILRGHAVARIAEAMDRALEARRGER